jgi:phospholipid-binding lipoprotein MlaA
VVDIRAKYLNASNVLEGAALDSYSFQRDAYFQRQRNVQFDGNPPDEESEP